LQEKENPSGKNLKLCNDETKDATEDTRMWNVSLKQNKEIGKERLHAQDRNLQTSRQYTCEEAEGEENKSLMRLEQSHA
jgi:hypothetical protein